VLSSSKSPAFSAAVRISSSNAAVSSAARNGRPVLVQMAPGPRTPKRAGASSGERHTSSTAREPMCFSSHSTDATPSAR